jgi:DNA-binding NarL/FixJ family response regulator
MIKTAIVDDHILIIEALEKLLKEDDTIHIINRAYTAEGCRQMLCQGLPDVLLLDVGLPDGDGIELCREITLQYPSLKVLILTTYAEIAVISRAMDSGALGYVLKNATSEEFLEGIYTVADGERFLCDKTETIMKKDSQKRITLTGREREMLKLIVKGKTNIEIADKLCLAYQTVKGYRCNLAYKLEVRNTAELVKMAVERKLV